MGELTIEFDTGPCAAARGYLVRAGYSGLTIINVRQPEAPRLIRTTPWPTTEWFAKGIALDGALMAISGGVWPPDTIPAPVRPDAVPFLRLFDMSDPAVPVVGAAFTTSPGFQVAYPIGSDVALAGGFALVTDAREGLRVIDLSDAGRPRQVASLPVGDGAERVVIAPEGGPRRPFVVSRAGVSVLNPVTGPLAALAGAIELEPMVLLEHNGEAVVAEGRQLIAGDLTTGLRHLDFTAAPWPVETRHTLTGPGVRGMALGPRASDSRRVAYLLASNDTLLTVPWPPQGTLSVLGSLALPEHTGGRLLVDDQGHVYSANREQAVVIVDVRDPTLPLQVGAAAGRTCYSRDIARYGSTVYSACLSDDASWLEVVDAAQPAAPRLALKLPWPAGGAALREIDSLQVAGSRLYVRSSVSTGRGGYYSELLIFDLADPLAPRYAGVVGSFLACTYGTTFVGYVAYAADCNGRLNAVDLADPARPRLLGRINLPGRPQFGEVYALDGLVLVDRGDDRGFIGVTTQARSRVLLPWVGRRR